MTCPIGYTKTTPQARPEAKATGLACECLLI